jgi:hypothetical protein
MTLKHKMYLQNYAFLVHGAVSWASGEQVRRHPVPPSSASPLTRLIGGRSRETSSYSTSLYWTTCEAVYAEGEFDAVEGDQLATNSRRDWEASAGWRYVDGVYREESLPVRETWRSTSSGGIWPTSEKEISSGARFVEWGSNIQHLQNHAESTQRVLHSFSVDIQ